MALTQISTAGVKDDAITDAKLPANSVGNSEMKDDAVGVAELSASGTASSTTYLRGDNSWSALDFNTIPGRPGGGTGLDFDDNVKVRWGTGNDLEIYHDGTSSIIKETGIGHLCLLTDELRVINAANTETMLKATSDGAVQLYYNDDVKFITTNTGIDITGNIDLADNGKLLIGTGDDLEIYHDGTDSLVKNATGDLILQSTGDDVFIKAEDDVFIKVKGGADTAIECHNDGQVELYYDHVKKLETYSSGTLITGNCKATGDFRIENDTGKLELGTSADLQLYHDGSNSYIKDGGTGWLVLQSNNVRINSTGSEPMANFTQDGAVELYYDNSKKFETSSVGATVNGQLTVDGNLISYTAANNSLGLTGHRWNDLFIANDIDVSDNGKILLGTGDDLQIWHDSSTNKSIIKETGTGAFDIQGNWVQILNEAGDEEKAVFKDDGAVELYYDDSKKFETDANGAEVLGNRLRLSDNVKLACGAGADLEIYHDGSNSWIKDTGTGELYIDSNQVNIRSAAGEYMAYFNDDAGVALYYDDSKKLETTSTGATLTGVLVSDGLTVGDSDGIHIGASADLRLYHDGTDNRIDTYGIDIDFVNKNADGGVYELMIHAVPNGGVELYHDGSKKFETTTGGVDITGTMVCDGITNSSTSWFQGHCDMNDDVKFRWGTSQDLQIYHNGSNSIIQDNGTGSLWLKTDSHIYMLDDSENTMLEAVAGGKIQLRYDGSTKFETTTNGVEITGFCTAFQVKDDSDWSTYGSNTHVFQVQNGAYNAFIIEHASNSNPYGLLMDFSDFNPDNSTNYFIKTQDSAATRFVVYSDGDVWNHDTSYTGSDQTLKENIVDATSKLEDLKKLKVRNFNWKSDYFPEKSKKKQIGFIAQEVEEIFPSLISEHDIARGTPEDGHTPVMKKAIKQAWDPIIIKAMQELIEKIETLEAKVAALEAN